MAELFHKVEIWVSSETLDEGDVALLFDEELDRIVREQRGALKGLDLVAYQITGPVEARR